MEIELKNIYYKDKLYNFNYKFVNGKATAIMGDNPSNSLIASIIMGQISDFYGNVLIDGLYDYDKYDFYRNIGYVSSQPFSQFIYSSVKDEFTMKLKNFDYKLDKADKIINDVLKMVNLDAEILERKAFSLSDSEAFKISLAVALILNPKVLILDSVTTYMDCETKKQFLDLLKRLKDRYNKTIIIISNDINFLSEISDNYLVIDKGIVRESGLFEDFVFEQKKLNKYGINMPAKYKFIDVMSKYKKINKKDVDSIDDLVEVICCE